jgi:hypothetical protein
MRTLQLWHNCKRDLMKRWRKWLSQRLRPSCLTALLCASCLLSACASNAPRVVIAPTKLSLPAMPAVEVNGTNHPVTQPCAPMQTPKAGGLPLENVAAIDAKEIRVCNAKRAALVDWMEQVKLYITELNRETK